VRDWLSSATISRPESTDAICSAVSCTSTGDLHEHPCVPHSLPSMLRALPAVLGPERVAALADQARVRLHDAA
jgi:hypothetical protein